MIPVKVPSVGESITSGLLGKWIRQDGEAVATGDALFEIETDKVTSEVYAESAGVLKTLVPVGAEVKIGQVVAEIDEKAKVPAAAKSPEKEKAAAAAAPTKASTPAPAAVPAKSSAAPAKAVTAAASKTVEAPSTPLSPAVRALVEQTGVDTSRISGTGKDGRLTKGDVLAHQAGGFSSPAASNGASGDRETRRKMSPLRQKIAQRLVSAKQEMAILTTFNEADLSEVIALRSQCQERFTAKHGVKLGFMSFFVKAVTTALQAVPQINARIEGDEIVENHYLDIGVAISTDKGLVVPVLRGAERMSLAEIELAIADYAVKARTGKITLPDLEGGVFTITNGGIFGSLLSTPIINPPQSGILGMHTIQERPVAVNGRVEIRPMMYLALSYDHRIVDGRQAVTFLVRVKEFIEKPAIALLAL